MPTYQYQCAKGHAFELFQKISEKPRGKCPQCGAKASRVISGGAGLIFKGSGFYITDYGKDGKGARKTDSGDSATTPAETASKPETKADKPAAAKDEKATAAKPATKSGKPTE
jgi:putative FmdB family regulatory protein